MLSCFGKKSKKKPKTNTLPQQHTQKTQENEDVTDNGNGNIHQENSPTENRSVPGSPNIHVASANQVNVHYHNPHIRLDNGLSPCGLGQPFPPNPPKPPLDIGKIEALLKEDYRRRHQTIIGAWTRAPKKMDLHQLYIDLHMTTRPKLMFNGEEMENGNKPIDHKDLFTNIYESQALCILKVLVEGEAGSGKTTLCKKLLYDWSTVDEDSDDAYFIHEFTIVIYLEGRLISKYGFEKCFKDAFPEEEKTRAMEWVEANSARCLFIFDGLDEIPESSGNNFDTWRCINKIAKGERYSGVKLLCTSRSNECLHIQQFIDQFVMNHGFTPEKYSQYFHKFYNMTGVEPEAQRLKEFIEERKDKLSNLFTRPQNCFLFCSTWQKSSDIPKGILSKLTQTSVYEQVIKTCLLNYCSKNEIPLSNGEIPSELADELHKIQKLAFVGSKEQKTIFNLRDLSAIGIEENSPALKFGFMTKEYDHDLLSHCEDQFTFPHYNFQHYFAARYVNGLDVDTQCDIISEWITGIYSQEWLMFLSGFGVSAKFLAKLYDVTKQNVSKTQDIIETLKEALPDEIDFIPLRKVLEQGMIILADVKTSIEDIWCGFHELQNTDMILKDKQAEIFIAVAFPIQQVSDNLKATLNNVSRDVSKEFYSSVMTLLTNMLHRVNVKFPLLKNIMQHIIQHSESLNKTI